MVNLHDIGKTENIRENKWSILDWKYHKIIPIKSFQLKFFIQIQRTIYIFVVVLQIVVNITVATQMFHN